MIRKSKQKVITIKKHPGENFECAGYPTDEETLKNCSRLKIESFSSTEIGSGKFGVVYPITAVVNGKNTKLVVKKIEVPINENVRERIKEMYYEVKQSYEMGRLAIGPHVYDAFYYIGGRNLYQYIIMEKMDMSIAKWSRSNNVNRISGNYVIKTMLKILHKQVFDIGMFCSDVKTANYTVNINTKDNPTKVRMIDFGADWCNSCTIPKEYVTLPSLRTFSSNQQKEIFYSMCLIQLLIDMYKHDLKRQRYSVYLLIPFFEDKLFNEYVINQSSLMKILLYDLLEADEDQGIALRHYLKDSESQSNIDTVKSTFINISYLNTKIKNLSKLQVAGVVVKRKYSTKRR